MVWEGGAAKPPPIPIRPTRGSVAHAVATQQGGNMSVLMIVRVFAVVSAGLLAGFFFGDRAGGYQARSELSPASLVQFQQVAYRHFARSMLPVVLTALLAGLAWLVMLRSQWRSAEFWLIAASMCGMALIAVITRTVNIPLNNELMTWSMATPPSNLREIWAPWERAHTIRTFVAVGVLILEAVALSLRASMSGLTVGRS